MLDKLLRAPLPEQIVALLEKLEQNPDTSHLGKVEKLLDYYETRLTRYEEWVVKRQMRKIRNVIRREQTLNNVMRIVINEKTDEELRMEERAALYNKLSASTGTISGTLAQHSAAQQAQVAHIHAHQQLMNQAQIGTGLTYPTGNFIDPRTYWTNGSSQ
jgi:vacuolar-type H+-ATPase catalytic subunit A/Vma1